MVIEKIVQIIVKAIKDRNLEFELMNLKIFESGLIS